MAVAICLSLCLATTAAPAFGEHKNADRFYQRAPKLKKKGALAMLSAGEVKALLKEVKAAGNLVKQTRIAAEKAGGRGRYCPPKGAKRMGSEEYIDALAAMPSVERKSIDLAEATTRMMEKKFPCR
jgi:hypothetical protein